MNISNRESSCGTSRVLALLAEDNPFTFQHGLVNIQTVFTVQLGLVNIQTVFTVQHGLVNIQTVFTVQHGLVNIQTVFTVYILLNLFLRLFDEMNNKTN